MDNKSTEEAKNSKEYKMMQSIIADYKKETKDEKPTQQKVEAWLKKKGKDYIAKKQAQFAKSARQGAKLNYLMKLSHKCPEGEELYYFKKGGKAGCGCRKKLIDGGSIRDSITKFAKKTFNAAKKTAYDAKKWGEEHERTMKASGITKDKDWVVGDKCGGKVKKIKVSGCGSKMKKKN